MAATPISDLQHDGDKFFDCASLARPPDTTVRDSTEPISGSWDDLIDRARHSIGSLLAPGDGVSYAYDPNKHVTLFSNTTSAFARVLSQIDRAYAGSHPTLLTTDLEFPGCVAAIDDAWRGPVVMARVAEALVAKPADSRKLLHDALVRAHNFVKPRVVFASHVTRWTGQAISIDTLRNFRESNPRVIIVLDGSQAIGNVLVTRELLDEVDFYIASGHKWLGGMTTSGFVWRRDPDRWTVADPAQPFAYPGQLGGSGNAAAWSSLVTGVGDMARERPNNNLTRIARHNRDLGKRFSAELEPVRSRVDLLTPFQNGRPPSGLVTIGVKSGRGEPLVAKLRNDGYQFTVFDYETVQWRSRAANRFLVACDPSYPAISRAIEATSIRPRRGRTEIRLCFHYWHSVDNVTGLAEAIVSALRGRSSRRT